MRELFTIACLLGTTVAELMRRLTAQEFARWRLWIDAHQVGPVWEAAHRARLLAAVHNSGHVQRSEGGLFKPGDFIPDDPWKPEARLTPEQERAQLMAAYRSMLQEAEA